ncbi:MAG: tetratricopeptide repeat protein, partial [Planctomycetota bacterium]
LLRGNVVMLLPILVAWPAGATWSSRGPKAAAPLAALTLAGVLSILGPVAARNYAVGGVLSLTTSGAGTNVYGGNNPDNPYGRATEFDWVRGIPAYEAGDWQREAERRLGRELDAGQVSSYWLGEALRSMGRDPLLHATIFWRKLRLTLGSYEVPDNHGLDWAGLHVPILAPWFPGRPLWGTLGLAGVVLFCLRCARRRGGSAVALLWLLYLGTIVATVTSMRARLPLVLLTAPFAGGFVAAIAADPRADRRRWVERGAALALGALLTLAPVFSAEQRVEDLDKRRYNHAVYLLQDGPSLERAAEVVDGLLERRSDSSRIQTLAAELAMRQAMGLQASDPAAARAGFESARSRLDRVLAEPGVSPRQRFRAHTLAGALDNGLGDPVDAERHFRAAAEFDPTDREVGIGLARALLFQGRRDAAVETLEAILARGPDAEVEAILRGL